MKKKYYFVILFLVLAIFLSGCSGGGIVTPATDEDAIKNVIRDWSLALNDMNWNKAKGYCLNGSEMYYAVETFEDLANSISTYCNQITVNVVINVGNVSINGSYGQAYCYTAWYTTYCGLYETDAYYVYYSLQKIGNNWKLDEIN
jgi:hypothetical protein